MTGALWEKFAGLSRPVIIAVGVASVFGVIALRGSFVALGGAHGTRSVAHVSNTPQLPMRADIVDRNGELLATSVVVYSLYADPRAIWDADESAAKLATVLPELNEAQVAVRLAKRDKKFVWVRRGLTPRQRQAVFDLGLEGLGFEAESKRVYPRGTQSGHVLGHTDIDGVGQMGVERSMQEEIAANVGAIQLTLDSGVQFVLEDELAEAAERYEVEGAMGIVVEAATGKIRGLASWPAFNPNLPGAATPAEQRNRVVSDPYELGSIFKPFTVAAALEAGKIDIDELFDVRAPIVLRGRAITDTHKAAPFMTPSDILSESSNIGTVRIAQTLGEDGLQAFFARLGLMERAAIDLPASSRPLLPPEWTDQAIATTSYGHGIAVSPLAYTGAFVALANGGIRPGLQIVETGDPATSKRVMSTETAKAVTDMLREAVTDGTGKRADVTGYAVAGKTGTAEKPIAGGYAADRNVTSFAALFPANGPEYVVLIVLDDPRVLRGDGGAAAAWNAAPLAGRVIERIAPILDVLPAFDQATLHGASQRSVP